MAVLHDVNRGASYTAAVCTAAIVTRAQQLQRVVCCNIVTRERLSQVLLLLFVLFYFQNLKFGILVLDFKHSY
jgi:hypothetical protein